MLRSKKRHVCLLEAVVRCNNQLAALRIRLAVWSIVVAIVIVIVIAEIGLYLNGLDLNTPFEKQTDKISFHRLKQV